MTRKILFPFFISFLICATGWAQPRFIAEGTIEYERKVNIWAGLKGNLSEQLKKSTAQYQTDYFNLSFSNNSTLYRPGKVSANKVAFFGAMPANDNIVFSDFKTNTFIAQKNIYEKTYLIEDSLRTATWKIKDDFRTIAGFTCRRATTIIMDSVFVVAFYTDEILVTGGPESIQGLPGMILGLVINRLHTTWYATKVSVAPIASGVLIPPAKGTKTTHEGMKKSVLPAISNWGSDADLALWFIQI